MSDSQLLLSVRDIQTGEQWSFQDVGACPSLGKGMNGDGTISWSYPFTTGSDRLPPRHAHVEVSDADGLVQTGRIVRRVPPGTDQCQGDCQLTAEGYAASLHDRKSESETSYGPVWTGTSLGMTPEAAITEAVARLGSSVSIGSVGVSGFTLPDTENFQGRGPIDVVNSMTSFGAGLATPFTWAVRCGLFEWGPIDLAPRYQTLISDGAVITPSDDASRLYNRVIILWGKQQATVWPEVISYSQIPTIVDMVVNAGAEVKNPNAALQLAQGLYSRLNEIEPGWSWNFTIPMTTAVEWLGHGPINPWRLQAGRVLRVPDLDPIGRYGNKHPMPSTMLITSLNWDGNSGNLTGSCGEMRDPSAFIRRVMYSGTPSVTPLFQGKPGSVRQIKDAGKISYFGPFVSTSTNVSGAVAFGNSTRPSPIDYRVPAVVSEYKQTPITHEAPKPIKIEKGLQGDIATATGLLDTGLVWSDMPPGEIDYYTLSCTPQGNVTVEVYKAATTSSGPAADASGDMVPGTLLLTASITGAKFKRHTYATSTAPSTNSKPRNEAQSILLYKLTDIASATGWQLVLNGNRIVPGHPDGANTAPAVGKKSP